MNPEELPELTETDRIVFRNQYGETKTFMLDNLLHNAVVLQPKKWFDPILERLIFSRSKITARCLTCGRRIWFYGICCPKPKCWLSRWRTRRAFARMGDVWIDGGEDE